MKLLPLILAFVLTLPAFAETDRALLLQQPMHLSGLIRTDRAPRLKKWLYLKPGAYTYYYYEWLMPDGSFAVQGLAKPIENVPDRRPLRDSHPNLAIILWPIQFVGVGTAIGLSASKL
jgi:hypothetical protein